MSERFQAIKTIPNQQGGRYHVLILDTQARGGEAFLSCEVDEKTGRYKRAHVQGRWVDGLDFIDAEHAECMAAALNLGAGQIDLNTRKDDRGYNPDEPVVDFGER